MGRCGDFHDVHARRSKLSMTRGVSLPWTLAASVGALLSAVSLHALPFRLATITILTMCVVVVAFGTDVAVVAALLLLPTLGLLRRVSSGPLAYIENDPLVVVPLILVLSSLIRPDLRLRFYRRTALLCLLGAWLLMCGLLSVARTGPTGVYGLISQLPPVLLATLLVTRHDSRLATHARRSFIILGPLVAAYGLMQYVAPRSWDLQWIMTLGSRVDSTGIAVPGQFRVFGTMEGPGPFSMYLGLVVLVLLLTAAEVRRANSIAWFGCVMAATLTFTVLIMSTLR